MQGNTSEITLGNHKITTVNTIGQSISWGKGIHLAHYQEHRSDDKQSIQKEITRL